jgi:hypothetical protein
VAMVCGWITPNVRFIFPYPEWPIYRSFQEPKLPRGGDLDYNTASLLKVPLLSYQSI